jgi:hypothetical protein
LFSSSWRQNLHMLEGFWLTCALTTNV